MKLIGITGKSGAGKTTFSNLLGKHHDVGVIHVDDLMDEFKEKNLSSMMDNDGEGKPTVTKKTLRKILYSNKYIFLSYIKVKSYILDKKIERRIKEYEEEGKNIVVIESVHLKYFKIFKKLDKKIIISRPYTKRLESVLERDKDKNIDKETFVMWDIPYKKNYYKEKEEDYDYKIYDETLEEIEKKQESIYNELKVESKKQKRETFAKYYEREVEKLKMVNIQRKQQTEKEERIQ